MTENTDTPRYYEGNPSGVLSARVPLSIKMKFMELSMSHRMNQGEYLGYLIMKVTSDPNSFDPKKASQFEEQIKALQLQLEQKNAQIQKLNDEIKMSSESLESTMTALMTMAKDNEDMKARLEATERDKKAKETYFTKKQENSSEASKKRISEANTRAANAEAKVKELEQRLAKANKKLKDENITEGPFLGPQKLVQF